MDNSILSALVQLPVVAVFLWYVIHTTRDWRAAMDDERKRFLEALQCERVESRDQTERISEALAKMSEQMAKLTRAIIYHDMTVRGINPKITGSPEEMAHFIETGERRARS